LLKILKIDLDREVGKGKRDLWLLSASSALPLLQNYDHSPAQPTFSEVFILVICQQKSGGSCQRLEEKIMGEFTFEKIPFIDFIISGNLEKTTMIL